MTPAVVFTSRNPPPDVSRERFRRLAPLVPGSKKMGRVWCVPASQWAELRQATAARDDFERDERGRFTTTHED